MNDYEKRAQDFLKANGIKFRATLSDSKPASWSPSGHHYRVTLSRGNRVICHREHKRLTFDFWGSKADMDAGKEIGAYDVLTCLSGDVHCPETFEEFCGDYGYNSDSIQALQTFNRASRFGAKLRAFFTGEEIEALSEIN